MQIEGVQIDAIFRGKDDMDRCVQRIDHLNEKQIEWLVWAEKELFGRRLVGYLGRHVNGGGQ